MNIVYQNDRFEIEGPSSTPIEKLMAFGFTYDTGVLHTTNPLVVQKIKTAGIETTISQLALLEYQRAMTVADSFAMDADIYIPAPPNKKYKPFQKAGIKYAAARPTCLIGDEPGLGKTIQAIGVSNYDPAVWSILVIAPAGLKRNWRREFIWWDVKGLSIGIVTGIKDEWPETDVVIINYDVLKAYRRQLRAKKWDLLIVDEAHRLKNKRTNRAMEVLGGIKWHNSVDHDGKKTREKVDETTPIPADRKLFLTGTPALNGKPKELWPLVQALDPQGIGADWYTYAKTYCELREIKQINYQTHQMERVGWYWDGAENLSQLQQLLRQRIMVRRRKEDVLTELEPKLRMVLPIEPSGKLKKVSQSFDKFAKEVDFDEIPKFDGFSKFLHDTGLFLVKPAIELVEDKLEEHEKVVVITYHKDVNEKIAAAFKDSLVIDGDILPDDRQPIVDQFQTDPTKRVLVCTMMSVLEGLTMTAASLMIFVERDWVPGNIIQAEDRIHRIGQLKQAEYIHMVLEGSLGELQIQAFVDKHSRSTAMLDRTG